MDYSHWLDCRFPFDSEARNKRIESLLFKWAEGKKEIEIVDLGAGNGSNFKYYSPKFQAIQNWTCIESDPILAGELEDLGLNTIQGSVFEQIEVLKKADLVVSNALFDLFTTDQFIQIASILIDHKIPFLFTLNYQEMSFIPGSELDQKFINLYHQHMMREQSFGKSMGPQGPSVMIEWLQSNASGITFGASNWRIGKNDTPMINYLLDFMANAIPELDQVESIMPSFHQWLKEKRTSTSNGLLEVEVNHYDIMFLPEG